MTEKELILERIAQMIEDNYYMYHTHPHFGLVLDFEQCYYELVKLIKEYMNARDV